MTQTPIPNLVATLAVPTIISMLVTSVYNMADTYFVGQIGTSATAAVGVALPLMAVIQAIGFTFGQGSGNTVSRLLGQQKREEAESMISVAFFSAFLCGLVLGVLGTVFIEPMVHFLGATDTSAPYTIDYVHFILIGAPFMVSSLVLNNQFRFQGNAVFGMVGIFSGAIVNIVLDPIFIFALDLGTGGAALATILSQFLSFCLLVGGTFRVYATASYNDCTVTSNKLELAVSGAASSSSSSTSSSDASSKEDKPASSKDETSSSKEDKPASSKEEKPASSSSNGTSESTGSSSKVEKPASSAASSKEEKPASSSQSSSSSKEEKPASSKEDKPASSKEEKPASSKGDKEEKPASSKEEKPASSKTEASASKEAAN